MAKVKMFHQTESGIKYYRFWCPGCKHFHSVRDDTWQFNGNLDKPTLSPSILVRGTKPITDDEAKRILQGERIKPIPQVCHSFVRDGKIQFLGDCSHSLADQTVDLPDIESFDY